MFRNIKLKGLEINKKLPLDLGQIDGLHPDS
jgi:hypothetical protein